MLKKIKTKLRGKAGESIAETLISTLIAALALTMLAGAIGSAAKIVTGSRNAMQNYRTVEIQKTETGWTNTMQNDDALYVGTSIPLQIDP